jgi:uncharacterized protein YegP (UPF0339 family)
MISRRAVVQLAAASLSSLVPVVAAAETSSRENADVRFEIYKDSRGRFRWRLVAANNQTIATGQSYVTKAGCRNGIEAVQRVAASSLIEDRT